jgi:hypothetical protein
MEFFHGTFFVGPYGKQEKNRLQHILIIFHYIIKMTPFMVMYPLTS